MKITFFQRRPHPDYFSIETIFDIIRSRLPHTVQHKTYIPKVHSRGIWKRLFIIISAIFHQSQINHVTGDINFAVLLLKKRKTILTIHGTFSNISNPIAQAIYKYIWVYIPVRRARITTVVSETLRQELIKEFNCPPNKLIVIHNPISPIFKHKPYIFNKSCPRILQVGTKPAKNLPQLILALEGIPCKLVIVGILKPDQLSLLKQHRINYENHTNLSTYQMYDLYQSCDIVTLVSTYESFGLPIAEANAVGRPVVTANNSGMVETAADAACLVSPFNTHDIREGILKIIHNDKYRNELIKKGVINATRFDAHKIAQDYIDLYTHITLYRK